MVGKNTVISILCILFAIGASVEVLAKNNRKPASKAPPAPLECLGGTLETHGHALIVTPKLGRALKKNERKYMALLAQQDPVQLLQMSSLFKDADKKQILDISIDPTVAESGFSSLKNFVKNNKFDGRVPLKMATFLEKTDKKEIADTEEILDDLNNVDLRTLKSKIVLKWKGPENEDGDDTVFLQIETEERTVLAAIQVHDGKQDCLALDMQAHRAILPEGVDPKVIPENYLFNLPVAPPFEVSYFFGPRVFNSLNDSLMLERHPDEPIALVKHSKKPLDYLNKYWNFHSGVDFAVIGGTPIYAPYDGSVFAMGPMGCAGNTLVVAHTVSGSGNLVFSVYEHLMGASGFGKVVVKNDEVIRPYKKGDKLKHGEKIRPLQIGDPVFQGSLIAKSGQSGTPLGFTKGFKEGCVDGAHLHFELRVPKESSDDLARELAVSASTRKTHDMGRRFRFVEFETTPINPADFIYGIDTACQTRKNLEIENTIELKHKDKKSVPPLTAGLCSLKYERSLKSVPTIYKLTRRRNDLDPKGQLARGPSSLRR